MIDRKSIESPPVDFNSIVKSDYRALRFIPAYWSPRTIWGLDFFIWHIPLLKTTIALDFLIVWLA